MTTPAVHPYTTRVYEQLPLAYRDADEKAGWPLLSWLSLLLDQAGEISDVIDAIDVVTPDEGGTPGSTSALVDPAAAQADWLAWIAQFVGVQLSPAMTVDQQRAAFSLTFARGSKAAIIAAAQRYLAPGAAVSVSERTTDRWHYTVHVHTDDVLDSAALQAALDAENPAGMVMTLLVSAADYADLRDGFADYAAIRSGFADHAAIRDYVP